MIANRNSNSGNQDLETRFDALMSSYRTALPDRDASAAFMPEMWARIDARRSQTTFFTSMSRALVTFAVAASVLFGILVSSSSQANSYFSRTYIEVLKMDKNGDLDPMHPDRIAELEQD
jgi:hypothetical protein